MNNNQMSSSPVAIRVNGQTVGSIPTVNVPKSFNPDTGIEELLQALSASVQSFDTNHNINSVPQVYDPYEFDPVDFNPSEYGNGEGLNQLGETNPFFNAGYSASMGRFFGDGNSNTSANDSCSSSSNSGSTSTSSSSTHLHHHHHHHGAHGANAMSSGTSHGGGSKH